MGLFDWLVGDAAKEVEMVASLTYVAAADGRISPDEAGVIDRFCKTLGFTGISLSTMERGVKKALAGGKPDFSKFSERDKRLLLDVCGRVAQSDAIITDAEVALLEGLARQMGLAADEASAVLRQ